MSSQDIEALDYPVEHRDRARELLRRRAAVNVAMEDLPSSETSVRRARQTMIVCWLAVVLVVVTLILSATDVLSGKTPNLITLSLVGVALIALIVSTKTGQERDRQIRLSRQLTYIEHGLDQLRDDDAPSEGEAWQSVAVALDLYDADVRSSHDKIVLNFAKVALVGVAIAFVWFAVGGAIG